MALTQSQFEKLKTHLTLQGGVKNSPGFVERTKESFSQGVGKVKTAFEESSAGRNPISTGAKLASGVIEAAAAPLTAAAQPVIEPTLGRAFGAVVDRVSDIPTVQKFAGSRAGEITGRIAEDVQNVSNVAGAVVGGSLAPRVKVSDVIPKIPSLRARPELLSKATEFLAKDIDDKVVTVLKETPVERVDEYVKFAEEAARDPRALTPFDKVGDRMEQATRVLVEERKRVGAAKSEFTKPLRQGFDSFSGDSLVGDLTSLHNSLPSGERAFVKGFIEKAKNVKTKYAADQLIDEMQDATRTAGLQNIVPKGSALERRFSGVVEKYNQKLKDSLPKEYAELNRQYADLKNHTEVLSRALGEIVDGQSTRGGSLVKQFFSPAGKKTKVLFDYVKEKTGIDLAQDTVLAKFAMELFDDPRSRALLEGVPKSATGLIDKAIDFAVEKTGVGKGVQKSLREAEVRKAKRLAK